MLKALTMPVLDIWAGNESKLKTFMDTARAFGDEHIVDLKTVEIVDKLFVLGWASVPLFNFGWWAIDPLREELEA